MEKSSTASDMESAFSLFSAVSPQSAQSIINLAKKQNKTKKRDERISGAEAKRWRRLRDEAYGDAPTSAWSVLYRTARLRRGRTPAGRRRAVQAAARITPRRPSENTHAKQTRVPPKEGGKRRSVKTPLNTPPRGELVSSFKPAAYWDFFYSSYTIARVSYSWNFS